MFKRITLRIQAWVERSWYRTSPGWTLLFAPLEFLLRKSVAARQKHRKILALSPPVVVVGNISVGGTGKTPCVQALVKWARALGKNPGIISRGYGSKTAEFPLFVEPSTSVHDAGDEAAMLAQTCLCPVVIDPERARAWRALIDQHDIDLVISDDGLQHYGLPRSVEIAVIDGGRGLGNGHCLPVGPLREPMERLTRVDFILQNGAGNIAVSAATQFTLKPTAWVQVKTGKTMALDALDTESTYQAIAAIGNPTRFFNTLHDLGLNVTTTSYADHHAFSLADFTDFGSTPVLMTEKDAIKCRAFAEQNWWYLKVEAQLPEPFYKRLQQCLGWDARR